jgi:hypothetical protein
VYSGLFACIAVKILQWVAATPVADSGINEIIVCIKSKLARVFPQGIRVSTNKQVTALRNNPCLRDVVYRKDGSIFFERMVRCFSAVFKKIKRLHLVTTK